MSAVEASIARVLDAYIAAVYAKDAAAFLRLYDPAARVFDAWSVWSYEGAAALRPIIESWFASLGDERVKVTFEDVQSKIAGGIATVTAVGTYAAVSPRGERLRSMQNRLTWILAVTEGGLRILHEHTSVPVRFDDMKAILHRRTER